MRIQCAIPDSICVYGVARTYQQGVGFKAKYAVSAVVALIFSAFLTAGATAGIVDYQGFETDTSGWFGEADGGGWYGSIERTDGSGTGVTAYEGNYFAILEQGVAPTTESPDGFTAPFTRFGGYSSTFPGTYAMSTAIYLDTNWADGEGFNYSGAANGTDGNWQRERIIHVTKDTSTGDIQIGSSGGSAGSFSPSEDLEDLDNHLTVDTSGWFIFEHVFREVAGVLVIDMNIYDALTMSLLYTDTFSNPTDTIPGEVGGNRYAWFTSIDIDGGLYIDAAQLNAVPVPAALPLFGTGLAVMGFLGWRRKRRTTI